MEIFGLAAVVLAFRRHGLDQVLVQRRGVATQAFLLPFQRSRMMHEV